MNDDDVIRELTKIRDALASVEEHLMRKNESNAAAHMNPKVLYWPLTQAAMAAHKSVLTLIEDMPPRTMIVNNENTPGYQRIEGLAAVLANLDRCEHGRHEYDACFDCPEGISTGNPRFGTGERIGTTVRGCPIHVPPRGFRHIPEKWHETPPQPNNAPSHPAPID